MKNRFDRRKLSRIARGLLGWVFATLPVLWAQHTSAISGVISDRSGGRVAGVEVQASKVDTGAQRSVIADQTGYYRLSGLQPGEYRLEFRHAGFAPRSYQPVILAMDRESTVNATLEVAGGVETIEVREGVRALDPFASSVSNVVTTGQIEELPLNGRDYLRLATIQPGVDLARERYRNSNGGYGLPFSIAGSRPVQNSFRLDGVGINNYTGSTPGSINGVNLGVELIREFSVLDSTYSAEYGRAAGGVINAVTKSGGNQFSGSLYYFHRNDNLDARNFFDLEKPPEFRRHQLGVSLGGPLKKNRAQFYGNYEQVREVRGRTTIGTTLSDLARQGQLQSGSVNVDPTIARFLKLYPSPNGEVFGDTGLFIYPNNLESREQFGLARADFEPSAADDLMVRYSVSHAEQESSTAFAVGRTADVTRNQSAVLEENHVFSSRLLNSARFGFSRTRGTIGDTVATDKAADDPSLAFLPGGKAVGVVIVSGLTDFPGGTGGEDADKHAYSSFQLYDDLTFASGRHALKAGVSLERIRYNEDSQVRASGEYTFQNVAALLSNQPQRFRSQLPGSDTVRGWRQWMIAGYVQDGWRVADRLSFDFGARYEAVSVPSEVHGKVSNLDLFVSQVPRLGNPMVRNPSLRNFGPRVGFSFDLSGTGRTVVRGGYGIYFDPFSVQFLLLAGVRSFPFYQEGQIAGLASGDFPTAAYLKISGTPGTARTVRIAPDLSQPYVQHWNLHVEQELWRNAKLRLAYLGSHGVHLSRWLSDVNLAIPEVLADGRLYFPPNGTHRNLAFGGIQDIEFDGQSFYYGVVTYWDQRLRNDLSFQMGYTFAKSLDDASYTFAPTESANAISVPYVGSPKANRGPSDQDLRHSFVANLLWNIPLRPRGMAGKLLGGWRLGTITTITSGVPFSATLGYDAARTLTSRSTSSGQRPDLAPGASNNPITGDPNLWFDPFAFVRPQPGFLGNLGRNTLRGPGLASTDVVLSKAFSVAAMGDNGRLEFRFEGFNVLNHTNFNIPDRSRSVVFTSSGRVEDAGRITSAGDSRELQVGIRLSF